MTRADTPNGVVRPDAEQLALDLADANLRLDNLRKAMQHKTDCEAEVQRLSRELAQAKRRLKEAGWNLGVLLNREKR